MTSYPQVLQIETTAVCNAHCSFCPHSTLDDTKSRMSDELLAKIYAELESWPIKPQAICPFLTNEPFADPRIFDIIRELKRVSPSSQIVIFTNASLLNADRRRKLFEVGPIQLFCSLHHDNETSYRAELGLDFQTTVNNIDSLLVEMPLNWPRVQILKVGTPSRAENDAFISYCHAQFPKAHSFIATRWNWKGDIASHDEPTSQNIICPRSTSLTILQSGRVSLCCLDQAGFYPRGDINSQSMLDVYNGPLHAKYFSVTKSHNLPCKNCNMR